MGRAWHLLFSAVWRVAALKATLRVALRLFGTKRVALTAFTAYPNRRHSPTTTLRSTARLPIKTYGDFNARYGNGRGIRR